ncbi:winged helix-turn-helix domain-containing protein [Bacteroidota bacterium]
MKRRVGLDIKKKILEILKENGEMSLGEIERKTNTNNLTILNHIKELEFFDKVKVIKHEKNEKTGRPYTTVKPKR